MQETVVEAPAPSRGRKLVFRNVFITLLYFFSISIGSLFGFFLSYLNKLPQIEQTERFHPNIPSEVYAANGNLIEEFYVEKRVLIRSMSEISPLLKNAIIAVEDAHFFHHPGVDPWGILRALYVNLKTGRVVEGGSTLTQQLAKLLFLKPEKTMERKIQEAMLAVQLERRYTKEEVFLLYCNQIYLGHGVYGVQAAANYYFGKQASELNLQEAALIGGLPKAPQDFSPYAHPDRALKRRNHVLGRMLEEKFVASDVYEATVEKPLGVLTVRPKQSIAPYFTEEIRKNLEEKYGYSGIYESGLRIHSTLDPMMQKAAETALNDGLRRLDKRHGWRAVTTFLKEQEIGSYVSPTWTRDPEPGRIVKGIVLDVSEGSALIKIGNQTVTLSPADWAWTGRKSVASLLRRAMVTDFRIRDVKDRAITAVTLDQTPAVDGAIVVMEIKTGKIRALVGGSDFTTKKFDRATQAWRQTGSAFKPFVYAAAFERGFTPSDVMADEPISFQDPWSKEVWAPVNYTGDFLGAMTLRRALELSRNTVAVKLLHQVGVKHAISYIERFELAKDMQPYLPLALGASEATLINMVRAYGAFANQGLMMRPYLVEKILDRDGNLLEENGPRAKEVMRADIAYLMTDVLQGVVQRGTAIKARALKRPLAGKTGTTDDCTDAWFVGYTPSLICGVWVGYDEKKSLGKRETGAEAALPVWIEFMQTVLKDKPVEQFQATGNILTVAIDRLTGLRATPDCTDVILESFVAGTEPKQFCGPEHHGKTVPLQEEELQSIDMEARKVEAPQTQQN
ncbi:MAG TPA: PBP1A family penicillin-binding protein [Acidobacteriota bacterium]|nr:PBP1A family penicillin-binding protein [Acidobacteriota bacterium]